jgi:hypothetical protein
MKHKLIALALVTVLICMVLGSSIACEEIAEPPPPQYELTISSTEGGSVIWPGEGTFTYDEGDEVELVAEAEEGYYFVNWIGDVGTIADVEAAATIITMNGDYSITANFLRMYALVVGIEDYPGEDNDLPNFTNETTWVANYLGGLGYKVTQLLDSKATVANVAAELKNLVDNSTSCSKVVFHYNGHGTVTLNLLTSGMYLYDGTLNSSEMKDILASMQYEQFLLVFDCCVAGDFAGGLNPLDQDVAGADRVVVTASHQRRFGWMNPETGWGTFGQAFWQEGLGGNKGDDPPTGNNDGAASAEEAFLYVKQQVDPYLIESNPQISDQYQSPLPYTEQLLL